MMQKLLVKGKHIRKPPEFKNLHKVAFQIGSRDWNLPPDPTQEGVTPGPQVHPPQLGFNAPPRRNDPTGAPHAEVGHGPRPTGPLEHFLLRLECRAGASCATTIR